MKSCRSATASYNGIGGALPATPTGYADPEDLTPDGGLLRASLLDRGVTLHDH